MTAIHRFLATPLILLMVPAAALDLELTGGAEQTAERASEFDAYQAPIGAFDGASVPKLELEGTVTRSAWRFPARGLTALQVIAPLRDQLSAQGYDVVFECAAADCGGFDFRFEVEVLPGPNMFVDITAFRFLTAVRGDREAPDEIVTLLASATGDAAYLQIIEAQTKDLATTSGGSMVSAAGAQEPSALLPEWVMDDPEPLAIGQELLAAGRVVLRDLDFASGTAAMQNGSHPSLTALAEFLAEQPDVRIALVGHTDTVGGLAPNVALSLERASSVRALLIEEYGVSANRLDAEGMGYLAPVASNLTAEGRERNRRVEAVLLP
ncbi:MAG: OmpA family protein [Pseudomonadota bacterium]